MSSHVAFEVYLCVFMLLFMCVYVFVSPYFQCFYEVKVACTIKKCDF